MTTTDPIHTTPRQWALRTLVAVADDDMAALAVTLREAAADPGGVLALVVELARAALGNAQLLDPHGWRTQLSFAEQVEEES